MLCFHFNCLKLDYYSFFLSLKDTITPLIKTFNPKKKKFIPNFRKRHHKSHVVLLQKFSSCYKFQTHLCFCYCNALISNPIQVEFHIISQTASCLTEMSNFLCLSSGRTEHFALRCHQQPHWNRRLHRQWPTDERTWQRWPGIHLTQKSQRQSSFCAKVQHVTALFLVFQSGHRAFALAAEHGCVKMLQVLMEPYNMATMKPNKVRERTCLCDFAASAWLLMLTCVTGVHISVSHLQESSKSNTLWCKLFPSLPSAREATRPCT